MVLKVNVPPFIENGEKIIIDTRSLEYVKDQTNEIRLTEDKFNY